MISKLIKNKFIPTSHYFTIMCLNYIDIYYKVF